jgi:hypothetical protein
MQWHPHGIGEGWENFEEFCESQVLLGLMRNQVAGTNAV